MFEHPQAKRIKRSDFGREASPPLEAPHSPSPLAQTSFPSYELEYDFTDVPTVSKTNPENNVLQSTSQRNDSDAKDEQTFEFRLFATKETASSEAAGSESKTKTTVKLLPEQDLTQVSLSEARFLKPTRPDTYYFTSSLSRSSLTSLRTEYQISAVPTSDLLQRAKAQKWPGTAIPWRVIHINSPQPNSISAESSRTCPTERHRVGRAKPNKKRRLQLRKLLLARAAAAKARTRENETAEEKEKAMREKKTAKNRKVQLKRREKERLKKAQAQAATEVTVGSIETTNNNEQPWSKSSLCENNKSR